MRLTRRWATGSADDLVTGARWYDERLAGLGAEFADEVLATTDSAIKHPFVLRRFEHPNLPPEADVRKIQLERFSEYGVIYTVLHDTFWIVAVAHAKRRPGYWVDRLTDLSRPIATSRETDTRK